MAYLSEALAYPIIEGSNIGIRRRQLQDLFRTPGYNPLSVSGMALVRTTITHSRQNPLPGSADLLPTQRSHVGQFLIRPSPYRWRIFCRRAVLAC